MNRARIGKAEEAIALQVMQAQAQERLGRARPGALSEADEAGRNVEIGG